MKSSRKVCVAVGTGVVLAVAILALAGYLFDGSVTPTEGDANSTVFEYDVYYSLSPGENPPTVYVLGYLGIDMQFEQMMSFTRIGDVYVLYWYQTMLPAGDWGFKFQVMGGELTNMYPGPDVD